MEQNAAMMLPIHKPRPRLFFFAATVFLAALIFSAQSNGSDDMTSEQRAITSFRASHDAEIMAVEGVVSIATGLDSNGKPCLKIGTSVPPEEVRHKLPESVSEICHEVELVGKIEAQ